MDFLFTQTPLHYFVQSLWRDEAFSLLLAKKNVFDIISLSTKDFNPPLYFIALHFWIKVFGESEIAIRSLSLVSFGFLMYFFYLFIRDVLKIKNSFLYISFIFFLINPFLNYYAFEARPYAFFALLATMSFYFFYLKKPVPYLVTTTLGFYTHYFMIFVFFTQAALLFLNKHRIKQILTPLYLFIVWVLFVLINHPPFAKEFWIARPPIKTLLYFPTILYTGYEKGFSFYDKLFLPLTLVLYIIIFLGFRSDKKKSLFWFLAMWAFLPGAIVYLISFAKPVFLPRYLIFTTPSLILLLIYSLKNMNVFLKFILLILLFFLTLRYNTFQLKERTKANLRKTIREIKTQAKPYDLLYVRNELDFHVGQYYFDKNRVFIFNKTYEEIPSFVGKVLIPQEKVVQTLPSYPRKAFILKEDGNYDIQALF